MSIVSKILYLTQTEHAAHSINSRFDPAEVFAVPLRSCAGRRGDVVVVEPLHNASASLVEREQFHRLVREVADLKRGYVGVPLIIGEILEL